MTELILRSADQLKPGDILVQNGYPVEVERVTACSKGCCRLILWGAEPNEWAVVPVRTMFMLPKRVELAPWAPGKTT